MRCVFPLFLRSLRFRVFPLVWRRTRRIGVSHAFD
jgi:hypothetical protein